MAKRRLFIRERKPVLLLMAAGSLALLAGLRLYTVWQVRTFETKYPPPGRFLTAGGIRMHYVENGEGRPVVLIHGGLGSVYDFTLSVFDQVSREFRAVAVDRPGHGYSQRPSGVAYMSPADHARYVRGALAALKVERPILVGYSWGAAVALAYALEYPDEAAGLVLLSPLAYATESRWPSRFVLPQLPVVGPLFMSVAYAPIVRLAGGRMMRGVFWPDPVPPRFKEVALALTSRPSEYEIEAADSLPLGGHLKEMAASYGEIRVPTVIVAGDHDQRTPAAAHALPLHQAMPHSALVLVPNAGHALHFAHPEVLLAAIRNVAAQAAAEGRAGGE